MSQAALDLPRTMQRAADLYGAGRLAEAEQLCRAMLAAATDFHPALHLFGIISARSGRASEACQLLQRAAVAQPRDASVHNNYGNVLRDLGQSAPALASFERALALRPDYADAHNNRGNALRDLGRLEEALASYEQALRLRHDHAQAHSNRGATLQDLGRFDEALASHDQALRLDPGCADFHSNRGNALRDLRRLTEALGSYERALGLRADSADAWVNRGMALQRLQRLEEALASCDQALRLRPESAEAHNLRAVVLEDLQRPEEAMHSCLRALAVQPKHAEAHFNHGRLLCSRLEIEGAIASYERAISLRPQFAAAHLGRGYALLMRGDFEAGWADLEWRWKHAGSALYKAQLHFEQPLWLGRESLQDKTILLHAEQGLGDTLQFCRYASTVAAQGARVILLAPPQLQGLLRSLKGVMQSVGPGQPLPPFDYHCPLMSLPRALGTMLASIPSQVPYLKADPKKVRAWRGRLGEPKGLRVGLVWSGGFRPDQPELWPVNGHRNIPLETLAPLRQPGIEFYSLQKGHEAQSQLAELIAAGWDGPQLIDHTDELRDFGDTAALVENLNLTISVDTSTAHLVGALGRPVWLLNRYDTCWRWMLKREDTPWYPTMRLYRQQRPGDWDGVIERVRADLRHRDGTVAAQVGSSGPSVISARDAHEESYISQDTAPKPERDLLSEMRRAQGLYRGGQLASAEELCRSVLNHRADDYHALILLGVITVQTQRRLEAAEFFRRAAAVKPGDALAHFNHANVLLELGRLEEALQSYERTLELQPDRIEAHYNRAVALQNLKRFAGALQSFDQALQLKCDLPEAHCGRGHALRNLRRWAEALESLERALVLRPDYVEAHNNRGNVLEDLERYEDALESYVRALAIRPDFAPAHFNRGNVLRKLTRPEEALASFNQALRVNPDYADAYTNRGTTLRELLRPEEALASFEHALRLNPDLPEAHNNRGNALLDLQRFDEALASFEQAVRIEPTLVEAYINRGCLLHDALRLDEAMDSYNQALRLQPGYAKIYEKRALTSLLAGDLTQGWADFEWRWKNEGSELYKARLRFREPQWRGHEPLAGSTILLHHEQGFGDTLQFCRYAPLLAARGARVILMVPLPLCSVLEILQGVEVVASGEPLPQFDYHCPLMSLPQAFGTTLASIPSQVPYLKAGLDKVAVWRERLGARRKARVGLVWSGGFRPKQPEAWSVNNRRNIPLDLLAPLRDADVEFFSLQKGETAELELLGLTAHGWAGPQLTDFTAQLQDFADTAALIDNLDLVISVDTSTAHLAGALGRPVWLLNRYSTCWRWLLERTDSPWYPTLRQYRQPRPGDWDSVIERVREDLIQLAEAVHARP